VSDSRDLLIGRYLDGTATPEEVRSLDLVLQNDPEARRVFLLAAARDARLGDLLSGTAQQPAAPRSRFLRAAVGTVAAAGILIVLTVALVASLSGSPPVPGIRERGAASSRLDEPPRGPKVPPAASPGERTSGLEEPRQVSAEKQPSPPVAVPNVPPVHPPPSDRERVPDAQPPPAVTRPDAVEDPARPKAPTKETAVAAAFLVDVKGEAFSLREGARSPAKPGQWVLSGEGLETGDGLSTAVLKFSEGVRLEVGTGTIVGRMSNPTDKEGRRIELTRGSVLATVEKQPVGSPLVFATLQGEAAVTGTVLRLTVDPDKTGATRLEVYEGRVRLKHLTSGKTVDVTGGHTAVAAPGVELAARKAFFVEDFENKRAVAARWAPIPDGLPTTVTGHVEIDLSPRDGARYDRRYALHLPGGAVTRAAFRLPFRVSVDVQISHRVYQACGTVAFVPAASKELYTEETLWVNSDSDGRTLGSSEFNRLAPAEASGWDWPRRERWTVELDAQELTWWVNEKRVLVARHRTRAAESYHIRLEAAATRGVPKGTSVRFDNMRVEPLGR